MPVPRDGELSVKTTLSLRFVVDRVEPDHALEEDVELGVRGRISRDLVKRLEDVWRREETVSKEGEAEAKER